MKMVRFNEYEHPFIVETISQMMKVGINCRDTFSWIQNLDDFYANGNKWEGPRQLNIAWSNSVQYSEMAANKRYDVTNCVDSAFDAAVIRIPTRFKGTNRNDVIIHECVHFLQAIPHSQPEEYVKFDGTNWLPYVSQRVETEAHLVQIAYILEKQREWAEQVATSKKLAELDSKLEKYLQTMQTGLAVDLAITAKNCGIV